MYGVLETNILQIIRRFGITHPRQPVCSYEEYDAVLPFPKLDSYSRRKLQFTSFRRSLLVTTDFCK